MDVGVGGARGGVQGGGGGVWGGGGGGGGGVGGRGGGGVVGGSVCLFMVIMRPVSPGQRSGSRKLSACFREGVITELFDVRQDMTCPGV